MPLVVQSDQGGVAGANSYLSVADFDAYHADRSNSYPQGTTTAHKESALRIATDYLDFRFRFAGWRLTREQSTQWPRVDVYDLDDFYVEGIPTEIKDATAEYALRLLPAIVAGSSATLIADPTRDASGRRVRVSEYELEGKIRERVEFVDGSAYELPEYPNADMKLRRRGLVRAGRELVRA